MHNAGLHKSVADSICDRSEILDHLMRSSWSQDSLMLVIATSTEESVTLVITRTLWVGSFEPVNVR